MARRKHQKPAGAPPSSSSDDRFHTPFDELKALLRDTARRPPPSSAASPPVAPRPESAADPKHSTQKAPPAVPPPPPQSHSDRQAKEEWALFLAEMAGVKPLSKDRRGRVRKRQHTPSPHRDLPGHANVLDSLRDLVEGRSVFTIQYTDEYMEGVAPGIDQRLAQRLHRGDFAVQAHLDLHGHTVDEAKTMVDGFLTQAYTSGRRCVRLVHGRGLNSRDNRPVLKEQVQLWLSYGRLSRLVLAFATAPTTDGGAGAVYVLLRRGPNTARRSG